MLPRAIESCLDQTLYDYELIIGNNASTDQTSELVKPYLTDARVTLINRTENLGALGNIHDLVMNQASCDLIVIMSDDDYFIDKDYLATAVGILDADQTIGFVHGEIEYEDYLGEKSANKTRDSSAFISGKDFFMGFGTPAHNYAYLMTVVFRKSLAADVKMFSRPGILHGDSLSWLMMSTTCNVYFVESVVARYCMHGSNSITSSDTSQWLEDINFINIAYKYALDHTDWDRNELGMWLQRQRRTYCGKILSMLHRETSWAEYCNKLLRLQKEHNLTNDPILIQKTIKSIFLKSLDYWRLMPKFIYSWPLC